MITSLNSLIFSFDKLSGPLRKSKPTFASGEDMEVEYVYNKSNPDQFGIIINSWFYRVQPDGSLKEETPFEDYNATCEFTITRLEEHLRISGGYSEIEPKNNMNLWFWLDERYAFPIMSFKYHGLAYHVTI